MRAAGAVAVAALANSDSSFNDLTLAGDTARWWDSSVGNHVCGDDAYANGKALGVCDGTEGDTYYEFAGDSTVTAIADYSVSPAGVLSAADVPIKGGVRGLVTYVPMRDVLLRLQKSA